MRYWEQAGQARRARKMVEQPTVGDALREQAVKRLKKQADFRTHLLIYFLVNGGLVVIWAVAGSGFF
jgi:hypothetical protein